MLIFKTSLEGDKQMGYNRAIACTGSEISEKTGQLQARGVGLKGLCLPKQPPEHLSLVHRQNTSLSCSLESNSPGAQEIYPGVSQVSEKHCQLCHDQEHSHLYITHQEPVA